MNPEKVHWIAKLSDGTSVYQDDHQPGEKEPISWIRLADHCKANGLYITKLEICFRDHTEEAVPENAEAYYWINGIETFMGNSRTYHYYIVGAVLPGSDHMTVNKWLVPEILPVCTENRPIPHNDPLLIKKGEVLGEKSV